MSWLNGEQQPGVEAKLHVQVKQLVCELDEIKRSQATRWSRRQHLRMDEMLRSKLWIN